MFIQIHDVYELLVVSCELSCFFGLLALEKVGANMQVLYSLDLSGLKQWIIRVVYLVNLYH